MEALELQGARFAPLPPHVLLDLFQRWRERGDRRARERLIETHLRYVVHVAGKFRGSGLPEEDLVAHGTEGLLRALETWDPERGRLTTYARLPILQAMQDYAIAQGGAVSMSRGSRGVQGLWYRPPADLSLDAPTHEDSDRTRLDDLGVAPTQDAAAGEWGTLLEQLLEAATAGMGPHARAVAAARWSEDPQTLEQLADELGLSRERVRQLELTARCRAQAILSGHAARFGLEEVLRDRVSPRGATRAKHSFWTRAHWARLRNNPRELEAFKAKIRAARADQVMLPRTAESLARAGAAISAAKQRKRDQDPAAWAIYRAKLSAAAKRRKRSPHSAATRSKIGASGRRTRALQRELGR